MLGESFNIDEEIIKESRAIILSSDYEQLLQYIIGKKPIEPVVDKIEQNLIKMNRNNQGLMEQVTAKCYQLFINQIHIELYNTTPLNHNITLTQRNALLKLINEDQIKALKRELDEKTVNLSIKEQEMSRLKANFLTLKGQASLLNQEIPKLKTKNYTSNIQMAGNSSRKGFRWGLLFIVLCLIFTVLAIVNLPTHLALLGSIATVCALGFGILAFGSFLYSRIKNAEKNGDEKFCEANNELISRKTTQLACINQNINELNVQIGNVSNELTGLKESKSKLEQDIQNLRSNINELELEINPSTKVSITDSKQSIFHNSSNNNNNNNNNSINNNY